jgi:hypothetical protein
MKGNFKVIGTKEYTDPHITMGRIYSFTNGKTKWDKGEWSCTYDNFSDFRKRNPTIPVDEYKETDSIYVYQKGNEVIATLKSGKQTVKTAKARCNPSDTFDFETGAKLAVSRLLGIPVDSKEVEKAVKTDGNFKARCIATKDFGLTVGKVYEFINGFSKWNDGEKIPHFTRFGISHFRNFADLLKWFGEDNTTEWEEVIDNTVKQPSPIDWSAFKSGKFAVHCDTEEKAREFLKECDAQGILWNHGYKASSETLYDSYGSETCYCNYSMAVDRIGFCNAEYYKEKGIEVIDYTPSKPAVKEVSRKAKVGEWVKVLRTDSFTEDDCKAGDIFKTVKPKCEYSQSDGAYYDEDANNECKYISLGDYVVLEGYVPKDKPTIKEVHRPAKVGEWIRVVDADVVPTTYGKPDYKNGTILKAISVSYSGTVRYKEDADDGPGLAGQAGRI